MLNIEEQINSGRTLVEVLKIAKKLKENGADIMKVNAAITKKRRHLATEFSSTSKLNKVAVPMITIPSVISTHLPIIIKNPKSNRLILNNNTFQL